MDFMIAPSVVGDATPPLLIAATQCNNNNYGEPNVGPVVSLDNLGGR